MTSEGVDLEALYESLDAATRKRYERLKKKNDEEAELEWIERKKKSREDDSKVLFFFAKLAAAIFLAFLILSVVMFDPRYTYCWCFWSHGSCFYRNDNEYRLVNFYSRHITPSGDKTGSFFCDNVKFRQNAPIA